VEGNLTSASVAYYYATLSLLEAVLLGDVTNELTLPDVEAFTRQGHGLMTLTDSRRTFPESEQLAVLSGGFLRRYLAPYKYPVNSNELT
jgi:hypothetical protein